MVAHLNIQTVFIVFLCFVHCLLCCHSSALAPELQRKAYVNLWWNGESRRGKRRREREQEKTFTLNGPASKCMLINGCSINQWNIIKFKQCDFFSHLAKPTLHTSLSAGPKVTPIPMVRRTTQPSFTGGCHRSNSQSCITLVCCEAHKAIK